MSTEHLIGEALAEHTAAHGTTEQRIMYLGHPVTGQLLTGDTVNPRSVWAQELNGQPVQVLLPDYSVIPMRENSSLVGKPFLASKPPGINMHVLSLSTGVTGQQLIGANGVTPFESEHNDLFNLAFSTYQAHYVMIAPVSGNGQLNPRLLVLSDLPNGATSGLPLVAGATEPSYAVLSVIGGGTGADLSATGGTHKLVFQETLGGAFTVRVLASSDVPTGAGSPLTTKGDLYVYSTTNTRQPAGADYSVPIYDSSQTTGIIASSSATSALQVPVGTTIQQPTSATGLIRYNSSTGRYEFGIGSSTWVNHVRLSGDTMTGQLVNSAGFTGAIGNVTPNTVAATTGVFATTTASAVPLIARSTDDSVTNVIFDVQDSTSTSYFKVRGHSATEAFPRITIGGTSTSIGVVFNRRQTASTFYFGEDADNGATQFRGKGGVIASGANLGGRVEELFVQNNVANSSSNTVRIDLAPHSGFSQGSNNSPYIESGNESTNGGYLAFGVHDGSALQQVMKIARDTTTTIKATDAGTNAVLNALVVGHNSSGTTAANFGTGILVTGRRSTTNDTNLARIRGYFNDVTASWKATVRYSVYDSSSERDFLEVISTGTVPTSQFINGAYYGTIDTMTYAATISLDVTLGNLHQTTTVDATGNATINASAAGTGGQHIWILIINDGTSGKTITFGTNFKPNGTLTGTTSKAAVLEFVSNGSNWYEVTRTTGL